jgi:phosphoribosyl-AMP cyclohydrolase
VTPPLDPAAPDPSAWDVESWDSESWDAESWDAVRARLRPDEHGLVAAIAQQHGSGEVLMLAWMDAEALRRTLATRQATYWSRSRQEYWVKGATSGHTQQVRSVRLDCDGDAVLLTVDQVGGACHTGDRTCFDADVLLHEARPGDVRLEDASTDPSSDPSYDNTGDPA